MNGMTALRDENMSRNTLADKSMNDLKLLLQTEIASPNKKWNQALHKPSSDTTGQPSREKKTEGDQNREKRTLSE